MKAVDGIVMMTFVSVRYWLLLNSEEVVTRCSVNIWAS